MDGMTDDDDMTEDDFDHALELGQPVELDVQIARPPARLYTVSVSHGGVAAGGDHRVPYAYQVSGSATAAVAP